MRALRLFSSIVPTSNSKGLTFRDTSLIPLCRPQIRFYGNHAFPPPPPPPPPPFPHGHQSHTMYPGGRMIPLGSREMPLYIEVAKPGTKPFYKRFPSVLTTFLVIGTMIFISRSFTFVIGFDDANPSENASRSGVPGLPSRQGLSSIFGGSEPKPVKLDAHDVTFSDVRGCDEAKEELEEIVLFLKEPGKFKKLGGKLPKGALLVGPPGCGKTMLAKAIAKEAGVSFFYCSGSEFDEMFVGVGARRIRDLFSAAKSHGPALIFIDEIDALGSSRSSKDMSYSRMTLNQLLSEMDGFNSSDDVIVLAATNTPDTLDKALTRPGRFDRIINVDAPDMKGRTQILDLYLKKVTLANTVSVSELAHKVAKGTTGFTGADLQNLVNISAIRAVMLDREGITLDDLEFACDRVMMGAENHSKKMSEKEKRDTAYHEGGHALVALTLQKKGADPVHKATIVPRGRGVLGLVQQLPEHDRYSISREQMMTRLAVALAGRAAEDIILGPNHVTSGASSDFRQATKLATNMIRRFGFNDGLGLVDYETADTNAGSFISDKTKEHIESEVKKLIMEAYGCAKDILTNHRLSLDRIAEALLEFETLSGDELLRVIRDPKENLGAVFSELRQNGKSKSSDLAQKVKNERDEALRKQRARGIMIGSSSSTSIPVQVTKT